jgi:hypothetical protein
VKRRNNLVKKGRRRGGKNNVINIKKKICSVVVGFKDEKRGVTFGRNIANGLNKSGKALKPSTRRLFEIVERLAKKTNMIRRGRILKTRRLLTVDSLIKSPVEKSTFDVKLMNRSREGHDKTENSMNSARLTNMRKSFFKINTLLLTKTMTYPTGFVACKSTIRMKFVAKNPLARDNINAGGFRNKRPFVILLESIKIITHSGKAKEYQEKHVCRRKEYVKL